MIKDYWIDDSIASRLYAPDLDAYPLVIFAHGYGSNYTELEHYGPIFEENGIGCLFFDFCGGGPYTKSKGSMWDMSVLTELEDFEKVLTFAKTLSNSITVMGESQGGYVACLLASYHPELNGCIAWYPGFNIYDFASRIQKEESPSYLWGMPIGEKYVKDALSVDIYDRLKYIQQEVLIIHGTKDRIVPIEYSMKALECISAKLIRIIDARHGFEGNDRWIVSKHCIDYVKEKNNVTRHQ